MKVSRIRYINHSYLSSFLFVFKILLITPNHRCFIFRIRVILIQILIRAVILILHHTQVFGYFLNSLPYSLYPSQQIFVSLSMLCGRCKIPHKSSVNQRFDIMPKTKTHIHHIGIFNDKHRKRLTQKCPVANGLATFPRQRSRSINGLN